jgi:hypothetical protein
MKHIKEISMVCLTILLVFTIIVDNKNIPSGGRAIDVLEDQKVSKTSFIYAGKQIAKVEDDMASN